MSTLGQLESKWFRNAVAGVRDHWVEEVKKHSSLEDFCKSIAQITGLSYETVRRSLPAQNYADFQAHASRYKNILIANLRAAHRAHEWSKGYKEAFSTGAAGAVAGKKRRKRRRRRARRRAHVEAPSPELKRKRRKRRRRKAGKGKRKKAGRRRKRKSGTKRKGGRRKRSRRKSRKGKHKAGRRRHRKRRAKPAPSVTP